MLRLVRFFVLGGEVGYGLRILNRVVYKCHILVLCLHGRCPFIIAFVALIFHRVCFTSLLLVSMGVGMVWHAMVLYNIGGAENG